MKIVEEKHKAQGGTSVSNNEELTRRKLKAAKRNKDIFSVRPSVGFPLKSSASKKESTSASVDGKFYQHSELLSVDSTLPAFN